MPSELLGIYPLRLRSEDGNAGIIRGNCELANSMPRLVRVTRFGS